MSGEDAGLGEGEFSSPNVGIRCLRDAPVYMCSRQLDIRVSLANKIVVCLRGLCRFVEVKRVIKKNKCCRKDTCMHKKIPQ